MIQSLAVSSSSAPEDQPKHLTSAHRITKRHSMNMTSPLCALCVTWLLAWQAPLLAGPQRLTPARIAELASAPISESKRISIALAGIGSGVITPSQPEALIENIREIHTPSEIEPPTVTANNPKFAVTPITPAAFNQINAGWTIRLRAKHNGKVVVLTGAAEFTDVKLVNGAYGALAGPVYSEQGKLITTNVLQQLRQQTTISRFHLFAVPGEDYEILLYKGDKAEKHKIKVTLE